MAADGSRPPGGVLLVPVPGALLGTVDELARRVSRRIALPCRAVQLPIDDSLPRLAHRDQVDADALLHLAESVRRPAGQVVVAVTSADIGHPVFTFFFGRARRGGTAAVVSLARLSPTFYGLPQDDETTLRRAVQEILHELGHVLGLAHCGDTACVMRLTSNVESLDARGRGFCAACHADLGTAGILVNRASPGFDGSEDGVGRRTPGRGG